MKSYYYIGGIITVFIFSIFIVTNNSTQSISKEKAEKIALIQAGKDGYRDVKVWTRFNSQTKLAYTFSSTKNKDIQVWQVNIDAAHNPPIKNTYAASYFIDKKDGSVVSVIKGLTQAGMDLEISGTELKGDKYHFKLRNNGKTDYNIEWIEPFMNPKYESSLKMTTPKMEFKNIIPVNTTLSIIDHFFNKSEQFKAKKDTILGFTIKLKEEIGPVLIIDNKYLNAVDV
ncbi:hypothetical protein [Paenibacillus humicola]|uniref:hypothetical protein n=1 Tax=Paenibacillus humicola TaxID=3110540 RepID=UPI00237AEAF0|nr:hypothetical protein [Paenibacillus humicola]